MNFGNRKQVFEHIQALSGSPNLSDSSYSNSYVTETCTEDWKLLCLRIYMKVEIEELYSALFFHLFPVTCGRAVGEKDQTTADSHIVAGRILGNLLFYHI